MEKKSVRSAKRLAPGAKKSSAAIKAVPAAIKAVSAKKIEAPKECKQPDENFLLRISQKAYELYISNGHCHGRDQEHWFEAERMVKNELCLK